MKANCQFEKINVTLEMNAEESRSIELLLGILLHNQNGDYRGSGPDHCFRKLLQALQTLPTSHYQNGLLR